MSTAQTVKTYKILNKYFHNEDIAAKVVANLQYVIDSKFEDKKSELAAKQDLNDFRAELINKLNDNFKWMIAILLWVGAFIVALIKLL